MTAGYAKAHDPAVLVDFMLDEEIDIWNAVLATTGQPDWR